MPAPTLEHNCNSWMIIQRQPRKVIFETFNQKIADGIADQYSEKYEVLTAGQWLAEFNRSVVIARSKEQ